MVAKKKKSRQKPYWERAYLGHAYWKGKQKLGKVSLLKGDPAALKGKYRWEAAGRAGFSDALRNAKAAVENAVAAADRQLDLFA
jgi:hypothetical protein